MNVRATHLADIDEMGGVIEVLEAHCELLQSKNSQLLDVAHQVLEVEAAYGYGNDSFNVLIARLRNQASQAISDSTKQSKTNPNNTAVMRGLIEALQTTLTEMERWLPHYKDNQNVDVIAKARAALKKAGAL